MANYFMSYKNERLKAEIESVKRKIKISNSQQDKILLFPIFAPDCTKVFSI